MPLCYWVEVYIGLVMCIGVMPLCYWVGVYIGLVMCIGVTPLCYWVGVYIGLVMCIGVMPLCYWVGVYLGLVIYVYSVHGIWSNITVYGNTHQHLKLPKVVIPKIIFLNETFFPI